MEKLENDPSDVMIKNYAILRKNYVKMLMEEYGNIDLTKEDKFDDKVSYINGTKKIVVGGGCSDVGQINGIPNYSGFNVKAAIEALNNNAHESSIHQCAKYVRMAMEAGGLPTGTRPSWAWKYKDWLPTIGFKMIAETSTDAEAASVKPVAGDICCMYKPGANESHPGHICMYDGTQWISDFKQRRANVYSHDTQMWFFRWANG